MLKKIAKKILCHSKKKIVHKIYNNDIFLVSFPRSGNTWTSFVLANAITLYSDRNTNVNFFSIQDLIPEYDNNLFHLRSEGVGGFPRIIKSHKECNYNFPKVILLVRDPRDVMVSYFHYLKGLNRVPPDWTMEALINSPSFGIDAWVSHTRGWMQRAAAGRRTRIFRYEDLLDHPMERISALFHIVGYEIDHSIIEQALFLSSRERMKKLEQTTRTPEFMLNDSDFSFVRKGIAEKGKSLPPDLKSIIENKASKLMQVLGYD